MAAKTLKKSKKAAAKKQTFNLIHGVCPELVNLLDYIIECQGEATDVTLAEVKDYAENITSAVQQLVEHFGEETTLDKLEWLDEDDCDLCV